MRKPLLLFVAMVTLAGCGSTVSQLSAPGTGSGAGSNAGLSATGTPGVTGPGSVNAPAGATGGVAGLSGSGGAGGPAGSTGSTGSFGNSGGAPQSVAGTPNAPIKVGVVVPDASALVAAFGVKPTSDIFAPYKAQIAYLNAHGGIAGHKIDPTYVREDATSNDGNSANQAACTSVTQDHKVDIVLAADMVSDIFLSCLQQKGISSVDSSPWLPDHVDMARHPNLFAIDGMGVDRYASTLVKVSVARGILKSGATLGVLTEDCPWGPRTYNNVVAPLAKSYGVKSVTATISCSNSLSPGAVSSAESQTQQAVLKFRSEGVTDVIVLTAAEGFIVVQFTDNASGQKWYPHYLITTNAYPYNNGRRDGAVMFSSDALPNISGIGFKPYIDVGDAAKPGSPAQGAEQAQCTKMDPAQGYAKSDTSKTHWQSLDTFFITCDQVLTLKRMLEANGLRFDMGSLNSGFQQVLRTAVGAAPAGGAYAPVSSRRDGIGQVFPFSWNGGSQRFVYTGQHFAAS